MSWQVIINIESFVHYANYEIVDMFQTALCEVKFQFTTARATRLRAASGVLRKYLPKSREMLTNTGY